MKLTTVFVFGVFTLGSAFTLADHRHDDGSGHSGRSHHPLAGGQSHKAYYYHRIDHRQERAASRGHGDRSRDANYARVIDVEPVYRYYREPVTAHSCIRYDSAQPNYRSHTATVLGAVIGGALGHRIGDSHGDPQVAAVAGGLLGASVGYDIDRRATYKRALRVEGPCREAGHRDAGHRDAGRRQARRELVEYKVTYRYNGRTHHARMDYDPGEWVKLDVSITPA